MSRGSLISADGFNVADIGGDSLCDGFGFSTAYDYDQKVVYMTIAALDKTGTPAPRSSGRWSTGPAGPGRAADMRVPS